ncbi:TCR/Tet family MFS transporter [Rhizobium mongolense]|uniref:DHA1 family tetracycline resistance protein-like MFS transporter n=2 Tax=Rhizobium mongolense TaxID=57676 RepID=A0ABR6IMN3_9HYPH|nr:tetracycline resistance MFS efflux pump [Rhizobium mongolense]MBB4229149.1 DHA1 family tetracycline resistance protein-like MFS transporter [Rhizobium mongolense]TVZ63297.1 DHA1 family tetracycline resistance protein-like MFS transporter [Rhizobium mongolense USDA 1844]
MLDPKFVRRGLFLVFMILFLDVIGIAIIMPVLPAYLEELTGGTISDAALDGGWLLVVYAGMLFLFSPLLGNLSDRFGRRPILLLSVVTFAIDNLICAVATSFWMLFVGRALAGFSGGSYATCSAYIADISNDGNRAKNFGLIGIAFGVGFTIGPVIGGLLGEFGPRVPFFGAAALSFLNFAAAYFLLPETLDAKHRRTFEWKRANPLGALKQMRNYPGIGWVGAVMFLFWLAHAVYPSVWSFVSTYRYGWSEGQIGLSLGIYGIGAAIVMGLVLPKIVPVLGEWKTAIVGLSFSVVALTGYAFAWEGWVVYTVIILTVMENVADPPLRSIAAGKVPPSAQGELQGALTSLSSITTIAGPLIFTQMFGYFTGPDAPVTFAGAPYLLAAFFILSAALVFLAKVRTPKPSEALEAPAQ